MFVYSVTNVKVKKRTLKKHTQLHRGILQKLFLNISQNFRQNISTILFSLTKSQVGGGVQFYWRDSGIGVFRFPVNFVNLVRTSFRLTSANGCLWNLTLTELNLTLRMSLFGAAHGWGRGQEAPTTARPLFLKFYHVHTIIMKLGTVVS